MTPVQAIGILIGIVTIGVTWLIYYIFADVYYKKQEHVAFSDGLLMMIKGIIGGIYFGYGYIIAAGHSDMEIFYWISFFTVGLYFIMLLIRKVQVFQLEIKLENIPTEVENGHKPDENIEVENGE